MPFGIDKLTDLHKLSHFIVGEHKEYGILKIGNLSNLTGDFCISRLDNITKAEDGCKANVSGKLGIRGLKLKWKEDFDGRNTEVEEKVLDSLSPHKELNKLCIKNNMGVKFSSWIVNPSLTGLSSLKLINCNCKSLPSIGKLPQLKDVLIKGMDEVTNIGDELFGVNQSLETLHFEGLRKWKEWDCCEVGEQEASKFPVLRELSLKNCPQLEKKFPNNLPQLQKLVIHKCERLVVSIANLPSLSELEIDECKELRYSNIAEFASLKVVSLSNISQEREGVVHELSSSSSLETKVEEVDDEKLMLEKISSVESLTIRKCERIFSKLPKIVHSFAFLTELKIGNCSHLVSLTEFNFPPVLKKMEILRCKNLQFLVNEREDMSYTSSLLPQHLTIVRCDSLAYLSSRDDVAIHLGHLQILICPKLTRLFLNGKLPKKLKHLEIWGCRQLESIVQDFEEATCLEIIHIERNNEMKSLPPALDKLSRLQVIRLDNCLNLVTTCEEDESWLPKNLTELTIRECPKFEALPRSINNFTSLLELEVGCSADICFPEEGFLINLTCLSISVPIKMLRSIVEWGFDNLSCLRRLTIGGEGCSEMKSFPEEDMKEMKLPPSLTFIQIERFKNLECILLEGFHNLTSLEKLYIFICPKLTSLPVKCLLLSLGCQSIWKCPLLKQELERDNGRERSKITAHIPCVDID